jgi:hypothetical protein
MKTILSVTITVVLTSSATVVAAITGAGDTDVVSNLSPPALTRQQSGKAAETEVSVPHNLLPAGPAAPSAISTESCFTPPLVISRRRAAHPAPACRDSPTLTITPSRDAVQFGEMVTVSWTASEPDARVCIDGIGSALASSGSLSIPVFRRIDFHGRATTCNPGPGVTASVNLCQPLDGAIRAASTSITIGGTTTLSIEASGPWTLSSSLGNHLSRTSGFGADSVLFTGKTVGLDSLLLVITTDCDNISRGIAIDVKGANPEP